MRVLSSITTARQSAMELPSPRVLVPTMGALHAGHIALLRRARALAGKTGSVLVSIFVNPTQFGPKEDLGKYPRPRKADLAICENEGVDLVFAPETFYAADQSVCIDESALSERLCGASRPGHFRGVCTVVGKLFNLLQPQIAVFGEKDFQQLAIVRRMVRDLDFPVKVIGVPTNREADGLALSSRNIYLTPLERAAAPVIRRSLLAARGETSVKKIVRDIARAVEKAGGRIDYIEVVNSISLEPESEISERSLIVIAAFFGATRLIDNLRLRP